MDRRLVLKGLAAVPLAAGVAGPRFATAATPGSAASAGGFGSADRPLRWIVPFPPGGTSDLRVRQVAERLKVDAGWNVLVENKPGASGQIGSDFVAKAPADGYTLLLGTIGTIAINPHLFPQQPYDVARDLQPVTQFSRSVSTLFAHRDLGVSTLAELEARIRGGAKLAFASTGNATIGHMVGEVWKRRAGLEVTHVPYQGTAPAVRDFVGGQVPLLFETPSAVFEHVRAGVVVPLALTSARRLPQLPAVPTFVESGHRDMVFDTWQGAFTRRGVPAPVLAALHREIARALRHPEVVRSHEEQANVVVANTPDEFSRFVAEETARWARVVAETGVRVG
jgi:tripartite-type tricarboxylate transporter receptor subunit TctC